MASRHHLAQLNVAKLRAPLDEPSMAGFVKALEPLNALADGWPGFVWRLQTDAGDATSIRAFDDPLLLVNMSLWESVEALGDYVYRSGHLDVMRRRREWASYMKEAHLCLWWIPAVRYRRWTRPRSGSSICASTARRHRRSRSRSASNR